MRQRTDPLVPILGSAVALVVIGAVTFIFYPPISRWLGRGERVVPAQRPAPTATIPVWVCRSETGVALMIEGGFDAGTSDSLDRAMEGGPYHYLRLSVYNFARDEPFELTLPADGLDSPEGGPRARPAFHRLRPDASSRLKTILRGLGAVEGLRVERGRNGQMLLMVGGDPSDRTAFVSGGLRFERREVERLTLASWQARPAWEKFLDF